MATGVVSTQNINTPAIIASAGTALAANTARIGWSIQNVGSNPVFVLLGSGASSTVYHYVIKGGTGDSDGLGGSLNFHGPTVYNGIVTFAGTNPKVVVSEIAP